MGESLIEDVFLNLFKKVFAILSNAFDWCDVLFESVAAHNLDSAVLDVACADGQAYGYALELVVGKFESGTLIVGIVKLDAYAESAEFVDDRSDSVGNERTLVVVFIDGYDYHLNGREMGREHKSVVVGVGHDKRTH